MTTGFAKILDGRQILNRLLVVWVTVSMFGLCGCVQRRFLIRSEPEGAFVSIDRQGIGYTPVSVPFNYYGTREFQLEKDGYQTIRVQERIRPPWYEKFPISFVTENFWPRELRDERLLDFTLEPKLMVDQRLLFERANDLRENVQRGTVTAPIR
jgi:hypothetical protein